MIESSEVKDIESDRRFAWIYLRDGKRIDIDGYNSNEPEVNSL